MRTVQIKSFIGDSTHWVRFEEDAADTRMVSMKFFVNPEDPVSGDDGAFVGQLDLSKDMLRDILQQLVNEL